VRRPRSLSVVLLPLLAFAALLASCQDAEPPVAPTPEASQFSNSPGHGPRGTIAFGSDRDDPEFEIYVMKADGTGTTQLTSTLGSNDFPAWSPDGRQIAFDTDRDGPGFTNVEIYVMNADGTEVTRLINNAAFDGDADWTRR
jgi:Tol biopolymer transport system component